MGPATASARGRGQQQRNISATEMPSKIPPLCPGMWNTTGEIYGARKSRAKSSPRSRSPMCSWALGQLEGALSPCMLGAFIPASLSLRWETAGVCPAHHSPEPQLWSFCPARKMFRGKAAQELRFAAFCAYACPPPGSASIPSPFAERLSAFLLLLLSFFFPQTDTWTFQFCGCSEFKKVWKSTSVSAGPWGFSSGCSCHQTLAHCPSID